MRSENETVRVFVFITEEEAAQHIGVARRTLRDWRHKGRINSSGDKPPQSYVVNRRVLYELHELNEWILSKATIKEYVPKRTRRNKGTC